MAKSTARLSKQMKQVLVTILRDQLAMAHHCAALRDRGPRWSVGGTPARMASVSRALARLERRGLILRHGYRPRRHQDDPFSRTLGVTLTPLGMETAKQVVAARPSDDGNG